jgi:hypothetical protein
LLCISNEDDFVGSAEHTLQAPFHEGGVYGVAKLRSERRERRGVFEPSGPHLYISLVRKASGSLPDAPRISSMPSSDGADREAANIGR